MLEFLAPYEQEDRKRSTLHYSFTTSQWGPGDSLLGVPPAELERLASANFIVGLFGFPAPGVDALHAKAFAPGKSTLQVSQTFDASAAWKDEQTGHPM